MKLVSNKCIVLNKNGIPVGIFNKIEIACEYISQYFSSMSTMEPQPMWTFTVASYFLESSEVN